MAMKKKNTKIGQSKEVDHSKFTDKDGYLIGGVEVEMSNPQETQVEVVQGQRNILPEKKRSAKWY
jgi:queuine/archaeosine tRNA-ribosyltransferase